MEQLQLHSTLSEEHYQFEEKIERSAQGHPLEVTIPELHNKKIHKGFTIWERFKEFFPFKADDTSVHLGEGHTPTLQASKKLQDFMGIEQLYFKNETQNPTWSFKDRGSFSTIMMAKACNEQMTATISTGNMGHSIAAFGAKAGIETIIFVPEYTPEEKINAMTIHEATVVKVIADDYSEMKKEILSTAQALDIRMVSGNNPIRVEGYKSVAFELYEQFGQTLPDYIAVPVSACGHIRGIFKGFRELKAAGFIDQLPKMIVVQAKNNAPIVKALQEHKKAIMPFSQFHTIAEAITSGNPYGGNEIINKALRYDWLYASVTEDEILAGQKLLAQEGYFVEPATATLIHGVKQLASGQKIQSTDRVVLMLTGSGLKDMDVFEHHHLKTKTIELKDVKTYLEKK